MLKIEMCIASAFRCAAHRVARKQPIPQVQRTSKALKCSAPAISQLDFEQLQQSPIPIFKEREMNMEIRSADRSMLLEIESKYPAPSPHVGLSVKQSANSFTGKASPVWVVQENIKNFVQELRNLSTYTSTVLLSEKKINENSFNLVVLQTADGDILITSTIEKWYSCTENRDCELQSKITFKIGSYDLKTMASFFEKLI
ncbi:MAG: hypothetical protein U9O54_07035 [Chloroflexota bacterium]|nr:hypothetical protein [Chloroflexota bacterium]